MPAARRLSLAVVCRAKRPRLDHEGVPQRHDMYAVCGPLLGRSPWKVLWWTVVVLYASRNACSQPPLITLEVEVKVEVGKTPQPTGNQPVTRRKIEMGRRLGPRAGERG